MYDVFSSMCSCARCTGKERDIELGLDYFGYRYYASTMGRFIRLNDTEVVIVLSLAGRFVLFISSIC